MCSVFWHLDSTVTSLHMSITSQTSCLFYYKCNSYIFCLGPIFGWYFIHLLGWPLRTTIGFGSVLLSIDIGHIWSWHGYSYEKAYARVTSLLCRSLGPHIKVPIEHAVWNCMRWMQPVTSLGAQIAPMFCEFPQYIGWGLKDQPTWWLEVWLCMADLHIGQVFPVPL